MPRHLHSAACFASVVCATSRGLSSAQILPPKKLHGDTSETRGPISRRDKAVLAQGSPSLLLSTTTPHRPEGVRLCQPGGGGRSSLPTPCRLPASCGANWLTTFFVRKLVTGAGGDARCISHISHISHLSGLAGCQPPACFGAPCNAPRRQGGHTGNPPPRSLKRPARPQRDRIPAFYSTPIDIFLFFFFPL